MKAALCIERANPQCMSTAEIERTYQLVIEAYARTEVEIWGEEYVRMPMEEYAGLLAKGEVLIARLAGEIVGTLWVHQLVGKAYGFGLLAADVKYSGIGIGRELIRHAEDLARAAGANRMVLEILRPRDFEVPFKSVLAAWYIRLGYRYVKSMSFLELRSEKVEKAKLLKVPAVFDVYSKSLVQAD